MSEEWQLDVVGFGGRTIAGSVGVLPPIFRDPTGRVFSGDPAKPWTAEAITEAQDAGLISYTRQNWHREAGKILFYADSRFVRPSYNAGSQFDLGQEMTLAQKNGWDDELRLYVYYWTREQTFSTLANWATRLLLDSKDQLKRGFPERALDSAERARLATPPPERLPAEHQELRMEAFARMAAATILLKRDVEDVWWDAGLDQYSLAQTGNMKARAEKIVASTRRFRKGIDIPGVKEVCAWLVAQGRTLEVCQAQGR